MIKVLWFILMIFIRLIMIFIHYKNELWLGFGLFTLWKVKSIYPNL